MKFSVFFNKLNITFYYSPPKIPQFLQIWPKISLEQGSQVLLFLPSGLGSIFRISNFTAHLLSLIEQIWDPIWKFQKELLCFKEGQK